MKRCWRGAAGLAAAISCVFAYPATGNSTAGLRAADPVTPNPAHARRELANAQLPFIANLGQVDKRVAYYARTFAGTVFATHSGELIYALPPPRSESTSSSNQGWLLKESFVGGTALPQAGALGTANVSVLTARVQLPSVPAAQSVRLGEVWDGIEVEVHARGDNIEKIFTVAAGHEAAKIDVRIEGADLSVANDGSLVAMTANGPISFAAPYAYQEWTDGRREVPVRYRLDGERYGFVLGEYDTSRPVVIDPIIQSTYFGGSGSSFVQEGARELAIHPTNGDVYIAGVTDSTDLPGVTGGAVTSGVSATGFIARFSADLQTLEQATYFGGSTDEWIHALIVTSSDVYIAGHSAAATLPAGATPGAQPTDPNPGSVLNGFIARLPLSLTSVTSSTFLGGTSDRLTRIYDATLHPNGDLYVCGGTESGTLPDTAGGFDATNAFQNGTAFVARVSASLDTFQQLTYFSEGGVGGNGAKCTAIIADPTTPNEIYIGGDTGFGAPPPNLTGGVLTTAGNSGAWLARLNAELTQNPQSTWIAGAGSGVDPGVFALRQHPSNGDLYVMTSGHSDAPLPANATTNGGQPSCNGGPFQCLLVMRVNPNLTSVVAGTFYGTGTNAPVPRAFDHMAIDPDTGDVFVVSDGHEGLPNTSGGIQPSPVNDTGTPGIAVRIGNDLGAIIQATYLSGVGTSGTSPVAVALHPANGHLYVAGYTGPGFPQTSGGAQATFGGTSDGFVARMTPDLLGSPNAGTLQFSASNYAVSEGTTTVQVTVMRTDGSDGAVSVSYATSDGSASAGTDYTAANGTLSWASGDSAPKTFDIDVLDDTDVEGSEQLNLVLSNATGGATLGSQATATVAIADDDSAPVPQPGVIAFGASSYSGNENGGSVTLTLTRTSGADGAISVSVVSGGGSAAAGADYTALTQTVSWADGDDASKSVQLQILDDSNDEPNETIGVALSNATGGATLGTQSSATVTIVDDDAALPPTTPSAQNTNAQGSYGGGGAMHGAWLGVLAILAIIRLRRRALAIACLGASMGVANAADVDAGAYIGVRGGITESSASEGELSRTLAARGHSVAVKVDERDTTFTIFGGYRWRNGFGIEAGLMDLGEYDVALTGMASDPALLLTDGAALLADAGRGVSAALTWTWSVTDRFAITPRFGAYYWDSERVLSSPAGRIERNEHGLEPMGGIDLTFVASRNWSFGVAWEAFDAGTRNDVRAYTASISYRFRD